MLVTWAGCDVCSVPYGGFVVAAENGLYQHKGNGESVNDRCAFGYDVLMARDCLYLINYLYNS